MVLLNVVDLVVLALLYLSAEEKAFAFSVAHIACHAAYVDEIELPAKFLIQTRSKKAIRFEKPKLS